MDKQTIFNNYKKVRGLLQKSCEKSGRNLSEITVVGVTKYTDENGIKGCIDAGIIHIGENKIQQALPKIECIQGYRDDIQWHFIGHLQSNKVKQVLPFFSLIHSLDRLSLAEEIQVQATKLNKIAHCLLQVNISGEESKYGVSKDYAIDLAKKISTFNHINVVGLMTMAPYLEDPEETRPVFSGLRLLKDEIATLNLPNFNLQHLSMGMSNDFEIAVEEGATIVRLGSILFE